QQGESAVANPSTFFRGQAHRHHCALVVQNNLHDASQGAPDPVIGSGLATNNRVCRLAHLTFDLSSLFFSHIYTAELGERRQRHTRHSNQRPGEHFRVAMLTDHMGVNVLWIDAAMSSEKTTETSGVESGTRTKHT